jgi:hypothetical protein
MRLWATRGNGFSFEYEKIIHMYEYEKVHGIQTYYCKRAFKTWSDAADDPSTQHQLPLATTAAIGWTFDASETKSEYHNLSPILVIGSLTTGIDLLVQQAIVHDRMKGGRPAFKVHNRSQTPSD